MTYEATYHVATRDGYIGEVDQDGDYKLVEHIMNAQIYSKSGALHMAKIVNGQAYQLCSTGKIRKIK